MGVDEATAEMGSLFLSSIESSFYYVGMKDNVSNLEGKNGDVCTTSDGTMYCYLDEIGWQVLGDSSDSSCDKPLDRRISVTTCPHCAAALPLTRIDSNGICVCEYCGSPIYVW